MIVITALDGEVLASSKNLRALRRALSQSGVWAESVSIARTPSGEGTLLVIFGASQHYGDRPNPRNVVGYVGHWNGARCESRWASFDALCHTLANWQNLRGVRLRVNGNDCGVVGPQMETDK